MCLFSFLFVWGEVPRGGVYGFRAIFLFLQEQIKGIIITEKTGIYCSRLDPQNFVCPRVQAHIRSKAKLPRTGNFVHGLSTTSSKASKRWQEKQL
jgi:hypothetical protein